MTIKGYLLRNLSFFELLVKGKSKWREQNDSVIRSCKVTVVYRLSEENRFSKIVFSNLFPKKKAQVVILKNPDLDLIWRMHREGGFYGFMIRFGISPKKRKIRFGFRNLDLDFPKKTHPKTKIQTTATLFTAVNHCCEPLRKQKCLAQRGQKVMFMRCDWRISIHFVGFYFWPSAGLMVIDSSKTRKS